MGEDAWAALLIRQRGVVSRRQALECYSSNAIDRKVAAGRWRVAYRGVLVTHNGPLSPEQRLWAASLAAGNGRPSLLGGLSALLVLGLRKFTSDVIHVLVPGHRRDRDTPPGIRIHRTSILGPTDVEVTASPPCTRISRSMVDAAEFPGSLRSSGLAALRCSLAEWARTDREARTIIAMCFQQRLARVGDVDEVLHRIPNAKRRSLIVATVADVAAGSETVTELDLVRLCRKAGLPVPSRQVVRRDDDGRARYLDAYFDEWGIVVEVDGARHMEVDHWWRDMERHNAMSRRGETLLRFPVFIVRDHPAIVVAAIRDALHKAGWTAHLT